MLRSVMGVYDKGKVNLKEPVEVKGKANVIVTFLNEEGLSELRAAHIARLLNRKPARIAPLKVKDLIEEGRR